MNRILLLFAFIIIFGNSVSAQQSRNRRMFPDEMANEKQTAVKKLPAKKFPFPIEKNPEIRKGNFITAGCDTLSTTFAGGNGNAGNMFDITAINSIVINSFDGHIVGSGWMKIYYIAGTFAGNETNPSAWTLVDSAMVTSAGAGVPTFISIPMNILIPAGQTFGFYFTGTNTGASVSYTNGTTQGNVYSSNADLQIKEGVGNTYPFGGTFTPRIWNGIVHYCDSGSVPPPVPFFTGDTLVICPGDSVQFKDLSAFNPTSWSWSFPGGNPSADTVPNPVVTYTAAGTYNVTLAISNANGSDTLIKTNYILVLNNIGLTPIIEDFEGAAFPPANFYLEDGANDGQIWMHDTTVSAYGSGSGSMAFNNYSFAGTGQLDRFNTRRVDLTTMSNPHMYFDVAYSPFDTSAANGLSDTLAVYASSDCGNTQTLLYLKGGVELSADSSVSGPLFIPTPSQWRNDSIDLSGFIGQADVIIMFENRAHFGNMLYVDNINIGASPPPAANFSASPLAVCPGDTVYFTDNSFNAASWSWTFQGGNPAASTQQNPAVVYSAPGTYSVSLAAANANGTGILSKSNYIFVIGNMGAGPVAQDFEAVVFPPNNFYIVDDGNDGKTWTRDTLASGYGTGTASMNFDNFTSNLAGTMDKFNTINIDFTSAITPELFFDVAYSPYDTGAVNGWTDTLAIYASADCGNTSSLLYVKGGTKLSADSSLSTALFVPAASQWRTDSVDLSAFIGQADVMLTFENRAHFGNMLYIDNINIISGVGIAEIENQFEYSVFPNPVSDIAAVIVKNKTFRSNENLSLKIYDLLGSEMQSLTLKPVSPGTWKTEITREKLSAGMYFLKTDSGKNAGKLMVR